MRNKTGPVWHCQVPHAAAIGAKYYAYSMDGPSGGDGTNWDRFDSEKLLVDPYAQSIFFPPSFDREAARQPGTNMGRSPLGLLNVCHCPFDWGLRRAPRHGSDLIIYELHVRGFTRHPSSGVAESQRGTFAGIAAMIPYLKDLGITAVELMPIMQFDPHDGNYWGYMPLNFFSPHHSYSTNPANCQQHSEFRDLVKELHGAGIEVILDVVFNHTCEEGHLGPTYCYKGIDNRTYYLPSGNPASPYANYSGTGNTLHTNHRVVRQLILDSLRYWVREMHVDGFRFDLASIFSRRTDGSINLVDPPIFAEIAGDPDLAGVRMIAEPWDAADGYQLGWQFPGLLWKQWNGRFRDTVQRFTRGDAGLLGELMLRLYGSSDLFPDDPVHACRPFQGVNYVTSHDGLTLYDLTAYDHKRNDANGHQNTDGPNDLSWNCGWEGDEGVPADIVNLRQRQAKNFCCLLMLANGVPMFRMGDEFLHTQGGNNNPYNQDNETSWLNWQRLADNADMFRFFKRMIAFRKSHPSLGRAHFWREDIAWYGTGPAVDLSDDSGSLAFCLHGASTGDDDIYVMINGQSHALSFGIQGRPGGTWKRVVDTSLPTPQDIADVGSETPCPFEEYAVAARSIVILISAKATLGGV